MYCLGVTQTSPVPNSQMLTQNTLYQHIPWAGPEGRVGEKKEETESAPNLFSDSGKAGRKENKKPN